MAWHRALGFGDENYRFHDHDKLAHYANAATDVEYNFPFGFKEVEGIHSRTDFDLGRHQPPDMVAWIFWSTTQVCRKAPRLWITRRKPLIRSWI